MHTVGPGKCQETVKNMKNEKCTPQDLDYGEKNEKNVENEKHTLRHEICQKTLKNVENDKHTVGS